MKKLSISLLASVMALSLAACSGQGSAQGGSGSSSASSSEANVKLKDTKNLTEATSYQIQSMDYVTTALAEDHEYNANFVDGLLENDRFGQLKDCLAENYDVNEDATVYTFHLKKGIKWVTNTGDEYAEVTADDFVTGLRHGAEFESGTGWLLEGVVKGYTEYEKSDFSDAEFEKVGIKALDDYTLEFTLEGPATYFPSMTTYAVLYPVNRQFLESKGTGCKLGAPDKENCEFGTTAADSILYNGGYILESYDLKSSTVLKKNEAYWDADNVHLETVTRIYDDGSDPYSIIRGFEQGTYAAAGLSAQWEDFDAYIKKYDGFVTESLPNPTVFGVVFNFNRQAFNLTNYATDTALAENTHKAILNENFRKALRAAYDVKQYLMVSAPETVAVGTMRNINNFPDVVRTSDGKQYGVLVNEAYEERTGEKVDLSDGQAPWLSKEAALAYIEEAKKEGIEFPVHLDMLVIETNKRLVDQGQSMKKSIEDNTDGQIIIELVMKDSDTVQNIAYYNTNPAEADYDISTFTGWSPDYADPKSFVDIYSPVTGYYMTSCGLENGLEGVADADIKKAVGFTEYEELYRAADAITTDLDARYKAFAKADAELVDTCFYIPTTQQSRGVRVSHVVPFTRVYSTTGLTEYKYKGLQLQEDIVTAADYAKAYEAWQKGE